MAKLRKAFGFLFVCSLLLYLKLIFTSSKECQIESGAKKFIPVASNIEPIIKDLFNKIKCQLQSEKSGHQICIQSSADKDIYLPFAFIKDKFDINGIFSEDAKSFKLTYSYSKIDWPLKPYDTSGEYLWFANANVELRGRVKYISGNYGVPVTSQWSPKTGHIYPVQVAQFGLSHYSKWIKDTQKSPERTFLNNSKDWFSVSKDSEWAKSIENGFEFDLKGSEATFKNEFQKQLFVFKGSMSTNDWLILCFQIEFFGKDPKKTLKVSLKYQTTDSIDSDGYKIGADNTEITYYISRNSSILIRNLIVDICKAFPKEKCSADSINPLITHHKIIKLILSGSGRIKEASLNDKASFELAKLAADYLVQSQNRSSGGWPISAVRKFDKASGLYLRPYWHSAMAQGQVISLLCRLYESTNEKKYIDAAIDGVKVFYKDAKENGVRTSFMGKYVWFEEYPTEPRSMFVLNGFIYSLIGLRDLASVLKNISDRNYAQVSQLYEDGFNSLENLIVLFDTGSRNYYDLRHVFSVKASPNIARWDYHMLHVSQLNYFLSFQESSTLKRVRDRWIDYTKGQWSSHN